MILVSCCHPQQHQHHSLSELLPGENKDDCEDLVFHFPLTRSATVEEEEEEGVNEEVDIFDMSLESGLLQEIKIAEVG